MSVLPVTYLKHIFSSRYWFIPMPMRPEVPLQKLFWMVAEMRKGHRHGKSLSVVCLMFSKDPSMAQSCVSMAMALQMTCSINTKQNIPAVIKPHGFSPNPAHQIAFAPLNFRQVYAQKKIYPSVAKGAAVSWQEPSHELWLPAGHLSCPRGPSPCFLDFKSRFSSSESPSP